jgi:predicted nucleic acid-binding protein
VTRTRKYVLDTQIFIDAFRDPTANEALQRFHRAFAPFEYLSVVVAQELRAGMRRERDRKTLERNVLSVFERSGRAFAPSASAWHRSGDLLSNMARKEGLEIARVSKSFANDVLLALSCREADCVLVTGMTGISSVSVGTCRSTMCSPGPTGESLRFPTGTTF